MKSPPAKRPNLRLVSGRDAAALLLVILAVAFILENRGSTTIRVLIPEVKAPLWTALLGCVVIGVILGVAIAVRRKSLTPALKFRAGADDTSQHVTSGEW